MTLRLQSLGPVITVDRAGMAELINRIASGKDAEAFRRLFQAFAPRVKSYMMRLGADSTTAEELAQETLLTVWRKAGLYSSDKGSASTWVFTIARNLRIDRLRREVPWQELPDGHDEEASDDIAPDEAVVERERQVRVQAVMATLPQDQSEVVTLGVYRGSVTQRDCRAAQLAAGHREIKNASCVSENPRGGRGPAINMKIMHHPDDSTLMSYAAGSLAEALAAVVRAHVCMCKVCADEVRTLEMIGSCLLDSIEESAVTRPAPVITMRSMEADVTPGRIAVEP